ncbi:hypothetical protein [Bacillus massilinigeriensis]|uniref:hypothetical protein n=1 Tax=Bacillus mediterraneensis TaxID=1805474 RepID=UPI0008F81DCA|nr:hypothetical protein [Bacillus mediterraneensis]
MKKRRLGIDIDGTVTCPSSIIPFLNKDFELNITLQDIKEYDLLPLVSVSREEFNKWFMDNEPEIYKTSPLAIGAKYILQKWQEEHELYFISARGHHLLDVTKAWFSTHDLLFSHIELIGSHDKVETVKNFSVELFFEDKHDNAVAIHEQCGIPVILFNTPYNQDPIPEGVVRVNDWFEAKAWVDDWVRKTS